jgi:hypothetical protein
LTAAPAVIQSFLGLAHCRWANEAPLNGMVNYIVGTAGRRPRGAISWLFLISGIVGAITTFMMPQAPGFGWSLMSAILAGGGMTTLHISDRVDFS